MRPCKVALASLKTSNPLDSLLWIMGPNNASLYIQVDSKTSDLKNKIFKKRKQKQKQKQKQVTPRKERCLLLI